MQHTIELGPDDDFLVTSPSGRVFRVPNSPHATQYLWRILWLGSSRPQEERHPALTDEAIKHWLRTEGKRKREAERQNAEATERAMAKHRLTAKSEKFGVNLQELDFSL